MIKARPIDGSGCSRRSRSLSQNMLKGTSFEAEWTPDTVALVRSRLEAFGARYETVEASHLSR